MDIKKHRPRGLGSEQKFVTFKTKEQIEYKSEPLVLEFEEHLIRPNNPLTPEAIAFELVNCEHRRIWSVVDQRVMITPELEEFISWHRNKKLVTFYGELELALKEGKVSESDVAVVDRIISDYLSVTLEVDFGIDIPFTDQLFNMIPSLYPYLKEMEKRDKLDSDDINAIMLYTVILALPMPKDSELNFRALYIYEDNMSFKLNKDGKRGKPDVRLLSKETRELVINSKFKSISRVYIVTKDAAVLRLIGTNQADGIIGLLREHNHV